MTRHVLEAAPMRHVSAVETYHSHGRYNLHQIRECIRMAVELIHDSKLFHESIEWEGELVSARDIAEYLDKADTDLFEHEKALRATGYVPGESQHVGG